MKRALELVGHAGARRSLERVGGWVVVEDVPGASLEGKRLGSGAREPAW